MRIVTADDHPIFRDGLRKLLEAEKEFEIVGVAADGQEAIDLVRQLQPDVLLLDLTMPRLAGLDALAELSQGSVPVRTIILAAAVGRAEIVRALQLGARGIVLKAAATQLLYTCIRAVVAGEIWVGRESVADLVKALQQLDEPTGTPSLASANLTQREREIVAAIVRGASNRDVAQALSVSEQTIKNHLSRIFEKCGVSNRVELAVLAAAEKRTEDL
ncbi:MAG TPA: response regulator transcription factor [Vicinamibacterales bacterium]|nr:response regulator transcription factor [Vicinamibacterales bacterium]